MISQKFVVPASASRSLPQGNGRLAAGTSDMALVGEAGHGFYTASVATSRPAGTDTAADMASAA
jgi:hypothetical protein